MERPPRRGSTDPRAVRASVWQWAVLVLLMTVAAFALQAFAGEPGLRGMMGRVTAALPGEDIAELGRREVARVLEQRHYWGGLVASVNPALTSFEVNEIGRAVQRYSAEHGLPPGLIVAVITVESSGRVRAVSPKGAQGLMQVMPFWKGELGIEGTLFDIDNNIRAGTQILAAYIKEHGLEEGLARYYRGSLPVDGGGYYGKVRKVMEGMG